jgi:hypothetical protein
MRRDIGGELPSILEEVPTKIKSIEVGLPNIPEKVSASDGRYWRTIGRLLTMRT